MTLSLIFILMSFLAGLLAFPPLIRILGRFGGQSLRHPILAEHFKSKGSTPIMGGLVIILIILAASLVYIKDGDYSAVIIFTLIGYAGLGMLDDIAKLSAKKGLSVKIKLAFQLGLAAIIVAWLQKINPNTSVILSSKYELAIDFGWFYYILAIIYIAGFSNAVNITDGLDGLAGGILAIILITILSMVSSEGIIQGQLSTAASIGALLAFLWFNANPAKIFMGDVGSLPLGAFLALIAIIYKIEIVVILASMPLIIELGSTALQIGSFKLFKRRIFLVAPLHHHLEKKGWTESLIVTRFWLVSIISSLLALVYWKVVWL